MAQASDVGGDRAGDAEGGFSGGRYFRVHDPTPSDTKPTIIGVDRCSDLSFLTLRSSSISDRPISTSSGARSMLWWRRPASTALIDEQEIKRTEDALDRAGVIIEEKNWPPFYPIIHHDIAKEIPVHAQKLQYLAFASWLGILFCLAWNLLAVFICSITGGGVKIFFLAVIYAMTGIPLSYFLWTDSALKFGWFFLTYLGFIRSTRYLCR